MAFVKQLIVSEQMVQAYQNGRQEIPMVIMSFDKNVHRIVVPIVPNKEAPFELSEIEYALIFYEIPNREPIQFNGTINVEDKTVAFNVPDSVRGYEGTFDMEVDLILTDDRNMTLAQFSAEAEISDADKIDSGITSEVRGYYFELFEEWAGEIKGAKESATKEINKQVSEVTKTADNGKESIASDVSDVEDTKKAAKKDITQKVDEVETSRVDANKKIISDVSTIESSKEQAITDIDEDVTAVENRKNTAIEEINTKVEQAEDTYKGRLSDLERKTIPLDVNEDGELIINGYPAVFFAESEEIEETEEG